MNDGVTQAFNTLPSSTRYPAEEQGGRLPGLLKGAPKAICAGGWKYVFPSQLSTCIPANADTSQEEASGMHRQWWWGSGEGSSPSCRAGGFALYNTSN